MNSDQRFTRFLESLSILSLTFRAPRVPSPSVFLGTMYLDRGGVTFTGFASTGPQDLLPLQVPLFM